MDATSMHFRLGLVFPHPISAESSQNQLQPAPAPFGECAQQYMKVT